jgi:ectoine hydroxylase-related dioxygenase (phytanoyl-CoA dioxygenase family)
MYTSFAHLPADFSTTFDRDGYYVLSEVLSKQEIERARKIVSALCKHEEQHGGHFYDETGKVQRVWNLLNKHSLFVELIQRPFVMEAMEHIFDRPTPHQKFYLSSFQANVLYPGAIAQKIHIDTPFPEPLPLWPVKANTIWLVDDFTEHNGSTEVVPGSHKSPYKPKPGDETRLKKVIAKAGSVLFTHGNLWHRSGINSSTASRTVLLGSFAASYAREIGAEEDQVKVLRENILRNATGDLRKILAPDHGIKPGSFIQPSKEIEEL